MTTSLLNYNLDKDLRKALSTLVPHRLLLQAMTLAPGSVSIRFSRDDDNAVYGVRITLFLEDGFLFEDDRDSQPCTFENYSDNEACDAFREWVFSKYGNLKGYDADVYLRHTHLPDPKESLAPITLGAWAASLGLQRMATEFSWTLHQDGDGDANFIVGAPTGVDGNEVDEFYFRAAGERTRGRVSPARTGQRGLLSLVPTTHHRAPAADRADNGS